MLETRYLVGIDEAGRGPIAGPVAVGAVWWKRGENSDILELFPKGKLRDSKKLTKLQREKIFDKIKELKQTSKIDFAVTLVSNTAIDDKGITAAIRSGLGECLAMVPAKPAECRVLLDGSLRAPSEYPQQQTLVRGDENEPVIALASIVAKVVRDTWMEQLDKKYPGYGLAAHKGYGTAAHYGAIKRMGLSPIHRKSFLKDLAKGK
jgi:ribonuclease HII